MNVLSVTTARQACYFHILVWVHTELYFDIVVCAHTEKMGTKHTFHSAFEAFQTNVLFQGQNRTGKDGGAGRHVRFTESNIATVRAIDSPVFNSSAERHDASGKCSKKKRTRHGTRTTLASWREINNTKKTAITVKASEGADGPTREALKGSDIMRRSDTVGIDSYMSGIQLYHTFGASYFCHGIDLPVLVLCF